MLVVVSESLAPPSTLVALGDRRCSMGLAEALMPSFGLSLSEELWNKRGLRGLAERYLPVEEGKSRGLGESRDPREIRGSGSARARSNPWCGAVGVGLPSSVSSSMILSKGEDGKGSTPAGLGDEDASLFCEELSVLRGSPGSKEGLLFRCTVSSEVGFSSRWRYLRYRRRVSRSLTSGMVREMTVGWRRIILAAMT